MLSAIAGLQARANSTCHEMCRICKYVLQRQPGTAGVCLACVPRHKQDIQEEDNSTAVSPAVRIHRKYAERLRQDQEADAQALPTKAQGASRLPGAI